MTAFGIFVELCLEGGVGGAEDTSKVFFDCRDEFILVEAVEAGTPTALSLLLKESSRRKGGRDQKTGNFTL